MNCKKHNHKLKNLFKLSQVQMRLFPHRGVSVSPGNIFLNIVDEETAICSICEKEIPFIEEYADRGPHEFNRNSEYVYADLHDLKNHGIKIIIKKDPTLVEEWVPQDQEKHKTDVVNKIIWLADSLKKIGNEIYRDIYEEPFEIIMKYQQPVVLSQEDNRFIQFSIVESTIKIQYSSRINSANSDSILSWIGKKDDGSYIDLTGKISNLLADRYREMSLTRELNNALDSKINSRFLDLLNKKDIDDILKVYLELSPFILNKIDQASSLFLRELNQIKSYPNISIVDASKFLNAYDSLNAIARNISEEDTSLSTKEDMDLMTSYPLKDKYLAPICLDCASNIFEECSGCGEQKFDDDISRFDGQKICSRCLEDWSSCDDCGEMVRSEDMHYNEDEEKSYCENCYHEHDKKIDRDDFEKPNDLASQEPIFLSGNKQNLERLTSAIETLKNKTRGGPPAKLKQDFINIFKANGIKEDEAKIIINTLDTSYPPIFDAGLVGESDFKEYLERYINAIKNYISHQEDFYSKYPLAIDQGTKTENIYSGKKIELLKSYQPMPVDYEYDEANRGKSNFVIKMMPGEVLLDQAESLFPGIGKKAWGHFSRSGTQHHPGCIAYARISYDGNNFVIDNLQRDADLNNARPEEYKARFRNPDEAEMAEKALRWWDKRTSRWYVQFTDYLINFAKNNDKKLYLTNFDTQKQKWRRIPDRNAEVYDNLPEELSSAAFYKKLQEMRIENPSETVESLKEKIQKGEVSVFPTLDRNPNRNLKIEDLRGPVNGIWRLAKKYEILQIFKKSKSNN